MATELSRPSWVDFSGTPECNRSLQRIDDRCTKAARKGDQNNSPDGSARIGIHVRSHNGGDSESYVTGPPPPAPVPIPAAGWLLIAGMGGLVVMRRRARA